MTDRAIDLFYSYAHEDEALRDQLNTHLALLKKQGIIHDWYDKDINAGHVREKEIDAHLQSARIILLLISPDFMASDYCYGVEMQKALARHEAGEAVVIPIILRPCDWETAPFSVLKALPKQAEPVTMWTNIDAAFTDIAKGIRNVIKNLDKQPSETTTQKKRTRTGAGMGEKKIDILDSLPSTPLPATGTFSTTALKHAITRYYKELDGYKGKADYELAVRSAFQNLLAETARLVKWTLIPEQTLEGNIRPDGVLRDTNNLRRGFWEAKGPKSDLEKEISKKIKTGYPLTNTIFENTLQAVLYQNKKRMPVVYDLRNVHHVSDLLREFFSYTEPHIERFQSAISEFKERIPELASDLLGIIERGYKTNNEFIGAFNTFAALCRSSLNPNISNKEIDEMLVQHLLTERLFRTVFNNPEFVKRNVIAREIEKVIEALTIHSFNRQEFFTSLDRYYIAIEETAKGIDSWEERQEFLNTVYEGFFQGFSVKQADTHGIVYTPQEIVSFMCASVDEVLKSEFGTSISSEGVKILDPATGTGNFIVNLIRHHISRRQLEYKYQNDLFCNEITLLPYYIASLNIEHEYYEIERNYEPFEGICFADTLELAQGHQLRLFVEENTERVRHEKEAEIMVVIGNPPYNAWQKSENDNNKNRKYDFVDQGIRETYAKDSRASNKNALSDVYVKFFRWASDRLGGRDGIVCLVTNNSFIDQIAFDGMRKHLQKDFTQIYHLDLHGNVRKNPKLSGTTHNVFGIQVGVGITIAVRSSQTSKRGIYYYRVPENWRKTEKLTFLQERKSISGIEWLELKPDEKSTWLTEGLAPEFAGFLPLGTKEMKISQSVDMPVLFKTYSGGVKTNRDSWTYDFSHKALGEKVKRLVETYNSDLDRWRRRGNNSTSVDDFVTYDDTKIKWSESLKLDLQRGQYAEFSTEKICTSLYRPYCKQWLFFDRMLDERVYQIPLLFPISISESENISVVVGGYGRKHFAILASQFIPDLNFYADPAQCFPFYTYLPDGTNRRENITDWALQQFQTRYGSEVTKWDIFHYVYAMLHHPQYRERYAENLKRDLPHIPLLHRQEAFLTCVRIGKQLMDIHLNYEQVKEYPLEWFENKEVPFSWRVEKMRLSHDRRVVVVNESLRLGPLPSEVFEYRLGNRSALEWVIDQYQVSKDKRSGIESDPNRADDKGYIIRLVGRVVTVSVETVKFVKELAQAVTVNDWLTAITSADETATA